MRLPSFFLSLLFSATLFSQETLLYPIKVNHKWGYATPIAIGVGKVVIEPKYDAIGSENLEWHGVEGSDSGFRLVQVGDKLGLVNKSRVEVLSPAYKRIRPLNDSLFAVQIDSLFTVVNRRGEAIIEGVFDDVYFLTEAGKAPSPTDSDLLGLDAVRRSGKKYDRYLKVKKDERWGVYSGKGKEILPPVYAAVEWYDVGEGFFKIRKSPADTLWGLVNHRNKPLLPEKFLDIAVAGENFFAALPEASRWEAWDSLGKRLLDPVWLDVKPLNRRQLALQNLQGQWQFFSMETMDTVALPERFNGFFPLDEQYVLGNNSQGISFRDSTLSNGFVLLDSSAAVLKIPWFREVRVGLDSFYLGRRDDGWGMFTVKRGIVLPCIYEFIGAFKNGVAMVERNQLYGFMDTQMKEIVPPYFTRLVQEDSIIKAYSEDTLTVFKVNEKGEVFILQEVGNVRTLRVGKSLKSYAEAKIVPPRRRTEAALPEDVPSPFSTVEGSKWDWQRDPVTRLYGLKEASGDRWKPVGEPRYHHVSNLNNPAAISLLFEPNPLPVEQTSLLEVLPADSLFRLALFNHQSGKIVSPAMEGSQQPTANMLGLRGQDFKRRLPFAAFIPSTRDGRMGLVNKNGEQARGSDGKPLRFIYIGEFFEGRARVCTFGRLANAEDAKEDKLGVIKTLPLIRQFGIQPTVALSKIPVRTIFVDSLDRQKPRWGVIDTEGKFIVEPTLDYVGDYYDGMAVAQKNDLWGVLDPNGKVVIEFKYVSIQPFFGKWKVGEKASLSLVFNQKGYERAVGNYKRQRSFSEGLCAVLADSTWGFINEAGEEVIACQFRKVHDFSEGLAAAKTDSGWVFVDTGGRVAFEVSTAVSGYVGGLKPAATDGTGDGGLKPAATHGTGDGGLKPAATVSGGTEVSEVSDFHEGLAWFKTGYQYGYFDRQGRVKIKPQFSKAFDFQGNASRAVLNRKTGILDTLGNWLLKPERFERILPFDDWGMTQAEEKFKGKVCLLNRRGEVLTPAKFSLVEPFAEGFAAASGDRGWGLLDRAGKEVLPLQFEKVGRVSEGLVAVRNSSGWQYFDTLGRQAFRGSFAVAEPFRFGIAEVRQSQFDPESKYVIDRNGKRLRFRSGNSFQFLSEGILGFYNQGGKGQGTRKVHFYYGDEKGNNLFGGQFFQDIQPFSGGAAFVKRSGRWGLLNRNGLFLVEPKYPFANRQADGTMAVRLPILFGILEKNGKVVIPPACDRIEWMEGNLYRLELGEKIGYARADGSWVWEMKK